MMVAAAPISVPTRSVPVVSTVTWTMIGISALASLRARFAPLIAALICSGSWHVSIKKASTLPAANPAAWTAMASSTVW